MSVSTLPIRTLPVSTSPRSSVVSPLATPTLKACVALQSLGVVATRRLSAVRSDERGQSTAEYALVILGAAAVAALLMAWAGQTNRVGRLLDAVLDNVINRFR